MTLPSLPLCLVRSSSDGAAPRNSSAATFVAMVVRRFVCLVALVVGSAVGVLVAAPVAHAKVLNGCVVITPEELEFIFDQRFVIGEDPPGDYCQFTKNPLDKTDNILIRVLVSRTKDEKMAQEAYDRAATTATELAGSVSDVKGVGDEAFSSYFLGTDTLTVRVGRVLGRFRIDQPDSDDTFGLQIVAVAEAALPRLQNLSKAGGK